MGNLWNRDSSVHLSAIAGSTLPLGHDFAVKDSDEPGAKMCEVKMLVRCQENLEHAHCTRQ